MRMRRWLGLALSLLLVFAAGCQAVQGIDLNTVLKQTNKTISSESRVVYEFEVDLEEELLDEIAASDDDSAALLPLFTHVKLELDEIKVKNASNLSMNGTLTLGDIGIGFALQMTDRLMVLELDGASAPIVIDLDELGAELPEAALDLEQQRQVQELALEFLDSASDYLVGNMPNVSDISVQLNAPATVGGEELSLTRIGIRLDGEELLDWLKSYLEALAEDEEGVLSFMQAIAVFAEEQSELLAQSGVPVDVPVFGEDGEADIENAASEWVETVKSAALAISMLEVAQPEVVQAIFSDDLTVSADLYVDGKLNVRKQDVEINFRPDAEALGSLIGGDETLFEGINGIRIAYSTEVWNINGDVEPDVPQVPADGGVTPEAFEEWSTADALRFFGADSALFDLLADRFHMGDQELWLFPEDELGPIKAPNGWTLVPLRYTAEYLEADVTYDPETKQIIVRDDATGKEIVLTPGSSRVLVNGEPAEWAFPVTVMAEGVVYVPARNLIETLGGTIEWNDAYGWQVLILKRNIAELIRS